MGISLYGARRWRTRYDKNVYSQIASNTDFAKRTLTKPQTKTIISLCLKAMTEQVTIRKYPEREAFGGSFLYERLVKTTPELCVK